MSNDDLARLIFRVLLIIENASEWVSKNRQGFFKINPVSGAISLGLLPVPLKLKTHSGLNHITEPARACDKILCPSIIIIDGLVCSSLVTRHLSLFFSCRRADET